MTSAIGANSRFVSPGLQSPYSAGKNQFVLYRSVGIGNEKWEHSGGLYWLCGNPRTKDTTRYPMYGSVVAHERQPIKGVPTFVAFGHYYDTGDAAGDLRNNYIGPAYDPLTFKPGDAKNEVGAMLAPDTIT